MQMFGKLFVNTWIYIKQYPSKKLRKKNLKFACNAGIHGLQVNRSLLLRIDSGQTIDKFCDSIEIYR